MLSNPASRAAGLFAGTYVLAASLPSAWRLMPLLALPDALAVLTMVVVAATLFGLAARWLGARTSVVVQAFAVGITAALTLLSTTLLLTRLDTEAQAALALAGSAIAAAGYLVLRQADARLAGISAVLVVMGSAMLVAAPIPVFYVVTGGLPAPAQVPDKIATAVVDPRDYVSVPRFVQRPNVYLVGMLSAVPDTLLKRHLGAGVSALNSYLGRGEFRVMRNVFSETYPTRASFDLMLSMDRNYVLALKGLRAGELISGIHPSPLLTIFSENGYETNVLYEDIKFGATQGPYLDHYQIALKPSLCTDNVVDSRVRYVVFFGACHISRTLLLSQLRPSLDDVLAEHLKQVDVILNRERPQLTIMHLRPPFHYSGNKLDSIDQAAVENYASRYFRSTEQAAANLERLVDRVRQTDPEGLIFVFGDQGLGLSQEPKGNQRTRFSVQDRLGVVGAVSPPHACEEFLPMPEATTVVTTVQILGDLIACLAGGGRIYRHGYEHKALIESETFDLAPYVYE